MKKLLAIFFIIASFVLYNSCDKNKNVVLFSIEDDKALGLQVSNQIASDTVQFPVLSETAYPDAYLHINRIIGSVLNSGKVKYRNEFLWDVKIIHNDEVLNAFCTPGGYIYVYTGLIKYLDSEDQLAGVLGHEIGHADLRHSSRQLQNQYGISFLLGLLLGENPSQIEQIAGQIAGTVVGLKYSRTYESEADDNSVSYLSGTNYGCNGASGFFKKLKDEGQCESTQMVWLSTHPAPCDRIEDIDAKAAELKCNTTELNPTSYQDFKNSLP
ncbi:MAG TPA: M48 family metalloprotease [Cyclobacteriaceae bacterium]|nr:M48 family metalloprotease [Cyclobacteriaceae bacterium]